jgi:hypothetical protein
VPANKCHASVWLPCWRHLSPEKYREQVAGLVQEIDADAAAERKRSGRGPLGVKAIQAILGAHPHTWPNKSTKITGPAFPCGEQGCPRGVESSLRPLPGSVPGSRGEAQSWGSLGELPNRLLSTGLAVRGCMNGRLAAAG